MTLDEFKATKTYLPAGSPDIPQHVLDLVEDDAMVDGVVLYVGTYFIAKWTDGRYWLILDRDEYVSSDLGELEPKLFEWCDWQGL